MKLNLKAVPGRVVAYIRGDAYMVAAYPEGKRTKKPLSELGDPNYKPVKAVRDEDKAAYNALVVALYVTIGGMIVTVLTLIIGG